MISLARKLASTRYLDSATVRMAIACSPTTARMPTEKSRMPSNDSSSVMPFCRDPMLNVFMQFSFVSRAGARIAGRNGGIAHLAQSTACEDDPQRPDLGPGHGRRGHIDLRDGRSSIGVVGYPAHSTESDSSGSRGQYGYARVAGAFLGTALLNQSWCNYRRNGPAGVPVHHHFDRYIAPHRFHTS